MTLGDVLVGKPPLDMVWRMDLDEELQDKLGKDDMFAGYCYWNGKEIIATDGDSYSLEDEITRFKLEGNELVFWTRGWSSGREKNVCKDNN